MTIRGKAFPIFLALFALLRPVILAGEGSARAVKPLPGILDPHGTLDFDPGIRAEFTPAMDQARGNRNSAKTLAGAEGFWDDRFFGIGASGPVKAIAVSGSTVYVGGDFLTIGNIRAKNIARWDGSTWSALGSGVNGDVYALAVSGTDVYVGGAFDMAGGISANRIAKWDGNAWSALGSGMNSSLSALAVSGTDVYAGGYFTTAGGISAAHIAKWDGNAWSALGSGMNFDVYDLATNGTDLYAGGWFTTAGGIPANRIAKWDGSAWSALGSGIDLNVLTLAVSGTNVYAGGDFTRAGGIPVNNVAKWDGSAWSALGSGVGGSVSALAAIGTDVYAGGVLTAAGGIPVNNIAKWNGSAWSALGSGTAGPDLGSLGAVVALAVNGTGLYAGGWFTAAGGITVNHFAEWDGSSWMAPGTGPSGSGIDGDLVDAITASGADVYAGGWFTRAGGIPVNNIAKWDGSAWSALGAGLSGQVYALAVSGTDVYAGGRFTAAGEASANNIAKWDGKAWTALGSGLNGGVYAIAVSGTDIYVGGDFTTAGGIPARNIAKWDGSAWSTLGSGTSGSVSALALIGGDVFAAGSFEKSGEISANYVAKWDGDAWWPLGSGMNAPVRALAISGTVVLAGGEFTTAGGIPARNIAKWDGSAWSALGSPTDFRNNALAVRGKKVFAFTSPGGLSVLNIAGGNGSDWSMLGEGTDGTVAAMTVFGADLFCGGNFILAGDKPSLKFGIWHSNIVLTSPLGGEVWEAGSIHPIMWLSQPAVGNVAIEFSTDGGASWTNIVAATSNDGSYDWVVPSTSSSNVLVRISEAADRAASDRSGTAFSIVTQPAVIVTSPNGGEVWCVGSAHDVTWSSTPAIGEVKIEYSTDQGVSFREIVSSTANTGRLRWTVPGEASAACLVRVSQVAGGAPFDTSDATFTIRVPSRIALSRTRMRFGAILGGGSATSPQTVFIGNAGGGTLNWQAWPDRTWLIVSPGTGTGSQMLSVSIDPAALPAVPGFFRGTINVTDQMATNNPQTILVDLVTQKAGTESPPFGFFDTPVDGTTGITGAIPVTGWALDDIEVDRVEIWRDAFAGETPGLWFIGNAIFVEGARPDVEQAYPDRPFNYRGGWGYMMLACGLPAQGNGTYKLYAYATDKEGNTVLLGTKTITCDNAHGQKPFGTIDTPAQGGEVSGSAYVNFGWVLTPPPNKIPIDGSTIHLFVDGADLGHPTYNNYRPDIALQFPGYLNTGAPGAGGPVGYYYLDTRVYANGVHTIQWVATDDGGRHDGIGSRYFNIINTGTAAQAGSESMSMGKADSYESILNLPVSFEPRKAKMGFSLKTEPEIVQPDNYGTLHVAIKEVERIEVDLGKGRSYRGYLVVGDELRPLPIGSTLDQRNGTFSWMPGPGFLGTYELVFIKQNELGIADRIPVKLNIRPRFDKH